MDDLRELLNIYFADDEGEGADEAKSEIYENTYQSVYNTYYNEERFLNNIFNEIVRGESQGSNNFGGSSEKLTEAAFKGIEKIAALKSLDLKFAKTDENILYESRSMGEIGGYEERNKSAASEEDYFYYNEENEKVGYDGHINSSPYDTKAAESVNPAKSSGKDFTQKAYEKEAAEADPESPKAYESYMAEFVGGKNISPKDEFGAEEALRELIRGEADQKSETDNYSNYNNYNNYEKSFKSENYSTLPMIEGENINGNVLRKAALETERSFFQTDNEAFNDKEADENNYFGDEKFYAKDAFFDSTESLKNTESLKYEDNPKTIDFDDIATNSPTEREVFGGIDFTESDGEKKYYFSEGNENHNFETERKEAELFGGDGNVAPSTDFFNDFYDKDSEENALADFKKIFEGADLNRSVFNSSFNEGNSESSLLAELFGGEGGSERNITNNISPVINLYGGGGVERDIEEIADKIGELLLEAAEGACCGYYK